MLFMTFGIANVAIPINKTSARKTSQTHDGRAQGAEQTAQRINKQLRLQTCWQQLEDWMM
jgi:hypothetical protein